MTAKYYAHPPGYPSRWGVIDVGLRCFHHCAMCFTLYMDGSDVPGQGMKAAKFHTREHMLGLVDGLADNGFLGWDCTGGEPALHPDIIEIVERSVERGIASRIISLGQYLGRPMHKRKGNLIDELLAAGLTDFRLSVHEADEENFKELTGGSWAKQLANMNHLDSRNFQFMTNTTITLKNYKRLPFIAKEISQHNVYNSTLLFMLTHYEWSKGKASEIQPKYLEAAKYAREFVAILEDKHIPVITRYPPHCMIAGLERNNVGAVGVRYDPHEWMNAMDHKADPAKMTPEITRAMASRIHIESGHPSDGLYLLQGEGNLNGVPLVAGRGPNPQSIQKVFPKQCSGCSAMPVCDGIEPQYLDRFGGDEFVPYVNDDRGNVLDKERLAYLPAYFVKLKPDADMKAVIGRAFEPVPLCDNPKVSVIVTCYNYGKYLGEALDSVKAQTYDKIEVIIMDDGSTDDTGAIAASYLMQNSTQDKPWYYTRTENSGQPAYPRNLGISKSTGELIVCLDADDILTPTYIEECVQALRHNPDCSIAYTGVTCFGEADQQWAAPPFDYGLLLQRNFVTCASMFKKSMWDEVGGYKTYCRGTEDWNFWIQAAGLGHRGTPIPRQLWKYRIHQDGLFLTEVNPNLETKFRTIVLENSQLYPPQMVAMAKAGGEVKRLVG